MVIPIDISKKKYNVGDIVVMIKSLKLDICFITEGHEFIIIDIKKKEGYTDIFSLKDINSDIIIKISNNHNFTIKTDYNTAISNYKKIIDKKKFIEFISKNCPNKYEEYDYSERDHYDACKLKTKSYMKPCKPNIDCISCISNDKIKKNTFVLTYLRNMKINKIIK